MQLVVIGLSKQVPDNFQFRIPGADHHACWMSKGIYIIKIHLLSQQFEMSGTEKSHVERIFIFTVIVYARPWFLSPLASCAARVDLVFQRVVLKYREIEPTVAFNVLRSIRHHRWYITPQLIVLASTDQGLGEVEREDLAKSLFKAPVKKIECGKPDFPVVEWQSQNPVSPSLSQLITSDSWLIFNQLGIDANPNWLQTPCSIWPLFADYRRLEEFAKNVSVTNDIAERGIRIITDYIDKSEDEQQKQALLQVVENYSDEVTDLKKESLKNC